MKYDWKFFQQVAGYSVPSPGKKKKKVSSPKSKYARFEEQFHPSFTYHALVRLSERLQKPRIKDVYIRCGKFSISWPLLWNWIEPQLIRDVIDDITHSAMKGCLFSEKTQRVLIKWRKAFYALSHDHTIITIMAELEKEYRKEQEYTGMSQAHLFSFLWIK